MSKSKTPSNIAFEASGSPPSELCEDALGECWVCGFQVTRAMPLSRWLTKGYLSHALASSPESLHVCEACVYTHGILSPVPGRPPKEGKKRGGNFRNYSHMWSESRGYKNASKGEPEIIVDFVKSIGDEHWFLGVAKSGQKHVLPNCTMQRGLSGFILYEEESIPLNRLSLMEIHSDVEGLLREGFSKAEILGGWSPHKMAKKPHMMPLAKRFDGRWSEFRGGAEFEFQVFLARYPDKKKEV